MTKKDQPKLSNKEIQERKNRNWTIIVTISTLISTILITYLSDILLANTPLLLSFLILIFIIAFGVVSDVVGVAVTAVSPKPFNSMAAQKVFGAKMAVKLIKSAPRFSNICNDVIGDICGIVSGALGVSISAQFLQYFPTVNAVLLSLIMSGCIASLTVGGKALGKNFALNNSTEIIKFVAVLFEHVNNIFHR